MWIMKGLGTFKDWSHPFSNTRAFVCLTLPQQRGVNHDGTGIATNFCLTCSQSPTLKTGEHYHSSPDNTQRSSGGSSLHFWCRSPCEKVQHLFCSDLLIFFFSTYLSMYLPILGNSFTSPIWVLLAVLKIFDRTFNVSKSGAWRQLQLNRLPSSSVRVNAHTK